jgi:hypothetical protein
MNDNIIGGSVFAFISTLGFYFYLVKDDRHIFKWETVGWLVFPALFNLTNQAMEYIPTLLVRVPVEMCFYLVLWLLLRESWSYFETLD